MFAILNLIPVDKDCHVLPKLALIVQHVAACLFVGAEVIIQRFAHGCARNLARGASNVALNVLGKSYGRHT
jgi:hypothetical protein